jgi:cell division FtsZ-interacting protein ZapD
MASIFSAIGSVFGVVVDSSESMSSAISNFRQEQKLDHVIERGQRQVRLIKETNKSRKEMLKELQGISSADLAELNKLNEELGYPTITIPSN